MENPQINPIVVIQNPPAGKPSENGSDLPVNVPAQSESESQAIAFGQILEAHRNLSEESARTAIRLEEMERESREKGSQMEALAAQLAALNLLLAEEEVEEELEAEAEILPEPESGNIAIENVPQKNRGRLHQIIFG